jgi:tetratricopeptide (TPR) repeat protein
MRYSWRLSLFIVCLVASLPPVAFPRQQATGGISQHYAEAERAIQANDFASAERAYRAVLNVDARQTAAWTGLGVLQYGAGRSREAADSLHHALQIDSTGAVAAQANLFLGLAESDLGQCDLAAPLLQASFATAPHGKMQRLVGFAQLNCVIASADPGAGLVTISRLRTLYPDDPDVLYRSAELYAHLWTQAATELIAKHPESYRVHQLAGEVYEAQGRTDQAIREYKAALQENSRLPQMHYRLGQLYLREGGDNVDRKAMDEFRAELAADPQSAVTLFAMGEIERHQQELDAATEHYRAAMKLDPKIVDAQVGLAQILLSQKQVEPAIVQLKLAIDKQPENIQAHYVLMLAYRAQGNLAQAGVESVTFKKLQAQKSENFQSRMDALLGDKVPKSDTISR